MVKFQSETPSLPLICHMMTIAPFRNSMAL